jgi:hypothetical protein
LSVSLLDAPASAQKDPRAHAYIVDAVRPGATFTRHISVTNGTDRAQTLDLYPSAARIDKGSWNVLPGRASNELTAWVSVTPTTMQLPQGAKATAAVTVKVPSSATNGERYGVVLAATRPSSVPGQTVALVSRVGIRMYLAVSNSTTPLSDFTVDSLTPARSADGRPTVQAQVHNTGGRALDMSGSLRLSKGPGGLSAGPFLATLGTTLAPGDTEPVTVLLDKALPNGPWLARLDLQSGLLKRAATATITFPDKGAAAPVAAKLVQNNKKSPPWLLIGIGVLALLLLLLFLWFILKRRSRPRETRDDVVVQAPR